MLVGALVGAEYAVALSVMAHAGRHQQGVIVIDHEFLPGTLAPSPQREIGSPDSPSSPRLQHKLRTADFRVALHHSLGSLDHLIQVAASMLVLQGTQSTAQFNTKSPSVVH